MKYLVTRTIRETLEVAADNVEDAIIRASEAGDWEWDGDRDDPSYVATTSDHLRWPSRSCHA